MTATYNPVRTYKQASSPPDYKGFPSASELRQIRLNALPALVEEQRRELEKLLEDAARRGLGSLEYRGEIAPCNRHLLAELDYVVTNLNSHCVKISWAEDQ